METDIMGTIQNAAGSAAGTVAVVVFAWRKLTEVANDQKRIIRDLTIIMTKLGVHDHEDGPT